MKLCLFELGIDHLSICFSDPQAILKNFLHNIRNIIYEVRYVKLLNYILGHRYSNNLGTSFVDIHLDGQGEPYQRNASTLKTNSSLS
jgi:hypothetical protein